MYKSSTIRFQAPCFFCSLNRAWKEIQLATNDRNTQQKTMRALLKMLYDQSEQINEYADDDERVSPAWLGTLRERIIRQLTGNPDFYSAGKAQANQEALKLLPPLELKLRKANSKQEKFRIACLAAVVGNAMETEVAGHEFSLSQLQELLNKAEDELVIDQIDELFIEAQKATQILYLTDNAGEIVFDTLLVKELLTLSSVIVGVKDQPVMNDATLRDAETVGMSQITDVITTGADCVGVILSEVSPEFRDTFFSSTLVISKGMANLETLSIYDLQQPVIYALYRTKCNPVAEFSGVPRHRNIVARLDFLKSSNDSKYSPHHTHF